MKPPIITDKSLSAVLCLTTIICVVVLTVGFLTGFAHMVRIGMDSIPTATVDISRTTDITRERARRIAEEWEQARAKMVCAKELNYVKK